MTTTKMESTATSRRTFIKVTAAGTGALVIGTYIPFLRPGRIQAAGGTGGSAADLNAFVRISPDDTVTVICKHFEMGQGTTTGLCTLVAEELDADWSRVAYEFAPNDATYNNLFFGVQATGGTTSMANSFEQMRRAGATARAMLVEAAVARWGVPASAISVSHGVVSHRGSDRSARFGELASDAARLTPPEDVALKAPGRWTLIGTQVPRLDSGEKTDGSARFALDVRRPGMLRAVLARPPRFGAAVVSFEPAAALAVDGVTDVVQVPGGVAVLASDTWAAIRGRRALDITWDSSAAETRSTVAMLEAYRRLAGEAGLPAVRRGDSAAAAARATATVEAEYTFPYLAHAPMEPLNCIMELGDSGAEIWSGCQLQTIDAMFAARVLGIEPSDVTIHTLLAGGSFGRRGNPVADWVVELASIVKAIDGRAPVQLVWTREDDIRGGFYRPLALHRIRAGVADGIISGWDHRIVSQSVFIGTPFEEMVMHDGVDHSTVEGAADTAYGIPDMSLDVHNAESPVPVLWWRSVGHSHNAFVMETMMDELAHAAGVDPLAFRVSHLGEHPRGVACLNLAAQNAGWGQAVGDGSGRGLAYHFSYNTHVAMVADVSVESAHFTVDRIVAAVDCGVPINPDVIRAQGEGAVGSALSTVDRNEITFTDGVVDQHNFYDYEPTRMREMPEVDVHIVESSEAPTGIGEPGLPPLAPAVANALFAATGQRLRDLPLRLDAADA